MAGEGQDLGRALLHTQLCSDTQGKEQGLWETGTCYQDGSLLGKAAKERHQLSRLQVLLVPRRRGCCRLPDTPALISGDFQDLGLILGTSRRGG